MKCPFQIIKTETKIGLFKKQTEEKFANCLYVDCPYYNFDEDGNKKCKKLLKEKTLPSILGERNNEYQK